MRVKFDKASVLEAIINLAKEMNSEPVVSVRYIGGGGFGLVYKVAFNSGKVQVMKAFKVAESMQVEARSLQELRRASSLKIPEIFYTRVADNKYPFDVIAMECIQGGKIVLYPRGKSNYD